MKTSIKSLLAAGMVVAIPAALGAATAQENWTKDCQKCHSADGSGSGPMGKRLKLKNYADAAVNAAMTNEAIVAAIKDGEKDEATGKLIMPAYAAKYSEEEIIALRDLIRSFVTP